MEVPRMIRALPCPNCGCLGCLASCDIIPPLGQDLFNSDTSANYETISGSGAISGGAFNTSSSDAIFLHRCAFDDGKGKTRCNHNSSIAGAKTRVFGAWTDVDNHLFAEFEFVTTTTGILRLFKRVSGTNTELKSVTITSSMSFEVGLEICWDGVEVQCTISNGLLGTTYGHLSTNETMTGNRGGFGGDANGDTLSFGSFRLTRNACASCRRCAACNAGTIAEQIQVDIAGMGDAGCVDCSGLNTTYFLDYQGTTIPTGIGHCKWRAPVSDSTCTSINAIEVEYNFISSTVTQVFVSFRRASDDFPIVQWTKNISRPINCGLTLTTFTASSFVGQACDPTGSTVSIDPQ
jgi:hypothetical protein